MIANEYAVIFDLDGTLIDSMSNFSKMVIDNLRKRGIKDINKLIRKLENELIEKSRTTHSGSRVTLLPKLFWKIGRRAGLSRIQSFFFTTECIIKARDVYYNAPLFPSVKDSLSKLKLKGFELGVYSIASKKELQIALNKHKIRHFFNPNSIISRNDVKRMKPDPEGVLLALNGCSVHPKNAVYVGDMPFDIIAGNRAGTTTIGVTTGLITYQNFKQLCQPNMIFDSLQLASDWILNTFILNHNKSLQQ